MAKRVVFYLRRSDELCSASSLEDQRYRCMMHALNAGWTYVGEYVDDEASGRSAGGRAGYQRLLADAPRGKFDIVLAEAMDRVARRTADTTHLRDVLEHHGVELHSIAAGGLVTPMSAALYGIVAEQFSRDLADKTRRGQEGATRRGRVASGLAFGYVARPEATPNRAIDPAQARVVVRIFRDFADGVAPQRIAANLNAEGVAGPGGKPWLGTTIRGDATRQTGLLRNRLYVGEIVYGRMRFRKDPITGRRTSKPTGTAIVEAAPALRIVDQDLWDRAQERLAAVARETARDDETGQALNSAHRKRFVLSGLLRCGVCGGTYAIMGKDRYGCSTRKNAGRCGNAVTITRQTIEERVLASIKRGLLAPDMVARFVEKVTAELQSERRVARAEESGLRKQLATVERKIDRLIDQVEDGDGDADLLRGRLTERRKERDALRARLAELAEETPGVATLPNFAQAYAAQVRVLGELRPHKTFLITTGWHKV